MRKIRPIEGFNYDITSDGKVFSYNSKTFVKVNNGVVVLWKDENPHKRKVKALVEKYFPYKHKMTKTPRSKLNEDQVKEMRRLREEEFKTYSELAEIFGVTKSNAYKCCQRVYWRDI